MEQLDTRQLLQSITGLAEKSDVRALELSLIATLSKIIKAKSIKLCQLHQDFDIPERRVLVCAETQKRIPLDSEPGYAECLQTERKVVVPEDDHVVVIHPIRTRNGLVGFLCVECKEEDRGDQDIISTLLDFYKNYVSLLHDTERDVLTGLLNRRSFHEKVLQAIGAQGSPARRSDAGSGCCLAVIDIDRFKNVNDQYGHLVGDETLILLARTMADWFRGADLLFRMGEEFVVVLKDVDKARASMVLERLCREIEARRFPQLGQLTASIGASLLGADDLPMAIVDRANKALAYAKANGRNQVRFYEDLVAEGKLAAMQRETQVEIF